MKSKTTNLVYFLRHSLVDYREQGDPFTYKRRTFLYKYGGNHYNVQCKEKRKLEKNNLDGYVWNKICFFFLKKFSKGTLHTTEKSFSEKCEKCT